MGPFFYEVRGGNQTDPAIAAGNSCYLPSSAPIDFFYDGLPFRGIT